MKSVIYIDKEEETKEKPVEFTECLDMIIGWRPSLVEPKDYDRIVYLGNCAADGDMFAVYNDKYISIFKGHLNSGKY